MNTVHPERKVWFTQDRLTELKMTDRIEENIGRLYTNQNNVVYPSVTTVLGKLSDKKQALDKWKKSVGQAEAEIIVKQAADRGTQIHDIAERYMNNDLDWLKNSNHITRPMFGYIQHFLDQNIGRVYGIELPLYSDHLKTAGRADLIASYANKNSIIDFKNARREKKESWITDYFYQTTAYAIMVKQLYGIDIEQIVIIITIDIAPPQVFIKKVSEFEQTVIKLFTEREDYDQVYS